MTILVRNVPLPFSNRELYSTLVGIVSELIFWGMLEMGVAMVAVCLPTLAPLFRGPRFGKILRIFWSVLSSGSANRSFQTSGLKNPKGKGSTEHLGSTDIYTAAAVQHEAYAIGPSKSTSSSRPFIPNGDVWVDRKVTQSSESV